MRPAAFVLFASVVLAPASAQTASPTTQAKADKKICRTMESDTGSHFPGKRVCHTKSEWAATDAANAEGARALSDRAVRSGSINQ